jgi:RNA polymerase sigma factor (sigma-70 family)
MSSAVVDLGVDPFDPLGTGASPDTLEVRPEDEVAVQRVEQWFRDYAQNRDPVLRERIILAYLGLADRLADRYRSNRAVSLEDLRQVARLGLVKAVDRYQPERANPFIPYAVATVVGELKRHLRDASWRLRVPRGTKDLALRLCRAIDELPQQLGHSPTVPELAEYLGASMEEVLEAIEVAQTRSAPSLDQPAGEDGEAVLGDFVVDKRHRPGRDRRPYADLPDARVAAAAPGHRAHALPARRPLAPTGRGRRGRFGTSPAGNASPRGPRPRPPVPQGCLSQAPLRPQLGWSQL